jgi:predicted ATPase
LIERLKIKGFKSIRDSEIELGNLNVLIGANGSGKSNLLEIFRMLSWAMQGNLAKYIAVRGGGSSFLHYGAKKTKDMSLEFEFSSDKEMNKYGFNLHYSAKDRMIVDNEYYAFSSDESDTKGDPTFLLPGGLELSIVDEATKPQALTARFMTSFLKRIKIYQMNDTSFDSKIRQMQNLNDDTALKDNGSNLAPVLFRIKNENPFVYSRIIHLIKTVLPFFNDFIFDVRENEIEKFMLLRWSEFRQGEDDYSFDASLAGDGVLRIMALFTLLLDEAKLPKVLLLDEPELGLHPYALYYLVDTLKALSSGTQIIIATQSASLIDLIPADNVIIAERNQSDDNGDFETKFKRLDTSGLSHWLKEYRLSDLWDMDIIGGRPR